MLSSQPKKKRPSSEQPASGLEQRQQGEFDATPLFKAANPELYMSTKKRSTWIIVGVVWVLGLGRWGYLKVTEEQEKAAAAEKKRLQPGAARRRARREARAAGQRPRQKLVVRDDA